MRTRLLILSGGVLLALAAFDRPRAAAGEPAANTAGVSADALPALRALDAIAAQEWLHQPSAALLQRVIQASSKAALDEAAKTDPRAQALVGSGYYSGASGYSQSDDEAAKYFRLGAVSNPIAQTNLGAMLESGRANNGTPAPGAAAGYFQRAAVQGHPIAQLNLGLLCRDGNGVPRSYKEAARWFGLAAAQGNAQAQHELGDAYFHWGRGVKVDRDKAERLYKAAADQGNADGYYGLAKHGDYINWDIDRMLANPDAIRAFLKAGGSIEDDAHPYTTEQIEKAKQTLEGLRIDSGALRLKALRAYQRDAAQGSLYAMRRVGEIYYYGQGVAANYELAYASFKKASDVGDRPSLISVGIMTELGQGVAKDEASAVRIYKQLADLGDARGESNLARMTLQGLGGLAANRAEALRLYELAAKQGDESAQKALKQLGESR